MSGFGFDTFFDGVNPRQAVALLQGVLAFTVRTTGELAAGNDAFSRFAGGRAFDRSIFVRPTFDELVTLASGSGPAQCFEGRLTLQGCDGESEPYSGRVFNAGELLGVIAEPDALEWSTVAASVMELNSQLSDGHRDLGRSRRELLKLIATLQHTHDAERRRLAYALHEDVCQTIAGLKMYLEMLEEPLGSRAANCVSLARSLLQQVRALSESLASGSRSPAGRHADER